MGQDIDAECRSCGMMLAHTLVAMVGPRVARVRCNTCRKDHAYRSPKTARESIEAKRRAAHKVKLDAAARNAAAPPFDEIVAQTDLSQATKYSIRMQLEVHQAVDHPKFGLGVVHQLRDGKAQVVFRSGAKTLVYGR